MYLVHIFGAFITQVPFFKFKFHHFETALLVFQKIEILHSPSMDILSCH